MSGPYGGFGDQRDDGASRDACYEQRDGALETSRRSVKDVIRTFQTTVQRNTRSQQMMPEHAPVGAYVQPGLRKLASEGSRIARSVQQSAVADTVGSGFASVNERLGNMLARSSSSNSAARHSSERGIYGSGSMRSWGSTVSAEISTFTTKKVVPFFKRSNSCPVPGEYVGSHSSVHSKKEVSFEYQLMTDCE